MPLTAIAPNLWTATQPLRYLGLEVGSRMTVVRLPSGELALISPIELGDEDCDALNQLGPVGHIIAPNLFHYLSTGSTQTRYCKAKVWGVAGLAEKCPDVAFDVVFSQPGVIEDTLEYRPFRGVATLGTSGTRPLQETVFYHRSSRTLIITDIAFYFDQDNAFLTRLAAGILGSYKALRPLRLEQWATRDKDVVEQSVRQVLDWDFDRVITGHGSVVEMGGKAKLRAGYEWFLGRSLR